MDTKELFIEWSSLGDLESGRPNLGRFISVEVYRLMHYSLKRVIADRYGEQEMKKILYDSGKVAGVSFFKAMLSKELDVSLLISKLHSMLLDLKVGVLKLEKMDLASLNFVLTISEDIDCSGLPVTGDTVCDFDEGFIDGIFSEYFLKEMVVKEIDCWSTGDRTCRFRISPK